MNTKEAGHDINVTRVWQSNITGVGVVIAVVDDGKLCSLICEGSHNIMGLGDWHIMMVLIVLSVIYHIVYTVSKYIETSLYWAAFKRQLFLFTKKLGVVICVGGTKFTYISYYISKLWKKS